MNSVINALSTYVYKKAKSLNYFLQQLSMGSTNDITIDLPEPAPPDFLQNGENNNENVVNAKSPTKTKAKSNTMLESMKKHMKTQAEKTVAITPQNDLPTLKTPVEIDDVDNSTLLSTLLS